MFPDRKVISGIRLKDDHLASDRLSGVVELYLERNTNARMDVTACSPALLQSFPPFYTPDVISLKHRGLFQKGPRRHRDRPVTSNYAGRTLSADSC